MDDSIADFDFHKRRAFVPFLEELTVVLCEVDLNRRMTLNDHTVRPISRTDINDENLVDVNVVNSDVRLRFVVDGNGVEGDTVDRVALDQDDQVDFAEGDLHRVDHAEVLRVQDLLVLVEETLLHQEIRPFINFLDE